MARPREFDADAVLDRAMRLFWRNGYESTSLSKLVRGTGVAPKGLYAEFGNKEAFFGKCVDHYRLSYLAFFDEALAETSTGRVVEKILSGYVHLLSNFPDHPGCMMLNASLSGDDDDAEIRSCLAGHRMTFERQLASRLLILSDAPSTAEDETAMFTFARLVMTFVQGMAVQAKSGLSRVELEGIAIMFKDAARISFADIGKW